MSLIKGLRRRPLIAIATVLAFLVSAGIAVWYPSPLPAKASAEDKQHLQNQLRKGVGSLCNRVSALCGCVNVCYAIYVSVSLCFVSAIIVRFVRHRANFLLSMSCTTTRRSWSSKT